MRHLAPFSRHSLQAALLFLFCRLAPAAMIGDFAEPDDLTQTARLMTADGMLVVALADGGEMTVNLGGAAGLAAEPANLLQTLAERLAPNLPVRIVDFGGRPWFGNRIDLSDGFYLYHGYVQRNSLLHPVVFTLRGLCAPDAAVRSVLSRLQLLPGPVDPQAADLTVRAADLLARGETGDLPGILDRLEELDPLGWAAPYHRGRLAELAGNYAEARDNLALALARQPNDLETAAQYHKAAFLADGEESQATALYELAESAPDDPMAWEELARIHLLAEDLETGRSYLDAALAANPASRLALAALANLLAEEGDYAGAFRVSREMLYHWPGTPFEILPDLSEQAGELEPLLPALLSEPHYLGAMADFTAAPADSASDNCAPAAPLPEYVRLAPQSVAEQPVYIIEPPPVYVVQEPAPVFISPLFSLVLDLFGGNSHHRRNQNRRPDRDKRPPAFRPNRPGGVIGRPGGPAGSQPGRPPNPGGNRPPAPPVQPTPPAGGARPPRPPMTAAPQPAPVPVASGAPAVILPAPIQAAAPAAVLPMPIQTAAPAASEAANPPSVQPAEPARPNRGGTKAERRPEPPPTRPDRSSSQPVPSPIRTLPATQPTRPNQPIAPTPAAPPRQAQPRPEPARPAPATPEQSAALAPAPAPAPSLAQPRSESARPTPAPPRQVQPRPEPARPTPAPGAPPRQAQPRPEPARPAPAPAAPPRQAPPRQEQARPTPAPPRQVQPRPKPANPAPEQPQSQSNRGAGGRGGIRGR